MDFVVTAANFDKDVLKADVPVLVDFWAVWCGPCRMQNPILEEVDKLFAGKIKIGKVNVDENQELASDHNVMSIPTLKLFYKGKVVSEMIGVQSKDKLLQEIKNAMQ